MGGSEHPRVPTYNAPMSRSSRVPSERPSIDEMRDDARLPLHPLNKMEWTVPDGLSLVARHRVPGGAHRRYPEDWGDEASRGQAVAEDWVLVWPDVGQPLFADALRPCKKPTPRLLLTFAALAEATPSKYREFAQRYGPLGLCEHGTPCTHRQSGAVFGLDAGEINDQECDPLPEERIDGWRWFARQAATMLDIVIDLDRGRLVAEERWEPLRRLTPPVDFIRTIATTDAEARQRWPADTPAQARHKAVNRQRAVISAYISEWLLMAGIQPRFFWKPGRRGLDLVGRGGLFAAMALQLADTASGSSPLARCDNCQRHFSPRRRPDPNTDTFCSRAACKEARKKRYHRRKKDRE